MTDAPKTSRLMTLIADSDSADDPDAPATSKHGDPMRVELRAIPLGGLRI